MAIRVTDEEFIAAWKRYGSPQRVSEALNLELRGVYARRKTIEEKYGIILDSLDNRGSGRPKVAVPKQGFRAISDNVTGTVIIGSDGHFWPGERSVAFAAMVELIKDMKPAMVIMNGDSFDGARISRHPPGGYANLPDVADELDAVRERHAEIEAVAPNNCPLIWPAGNHDSRFTARLALAAPEFAKVRGFDIADHFPAWQFCWSILLNRHTFVKHKWHQSQHAGLMNTQKSGLTTVTGHLHRLLVTPWVDMNGIRFGVECGTLSELEIGGDKFGYAEDNPLNWCQGFVVLTFDHNGRLRDPELCRVINGTAYFRGQSVCGRSGEKVKILPQKNSKKRAA